MSVCEADDCSNKTTQTSDGHCGFCGACCTTDECDAPAHRAIRERLKTAEAARAAAEKARKAAVDHAVANAGSGGAANASTQGSAAANAGAAVAAAAAASAEQASKVASALTAVTELTAKLTDRVLAAPAGAAGAAAASAAATAAAAAPAPTDGVTAKTLFITPTQFANHPSRITDPAKIARFLCKVQGPSSATLRFEKRMERHTKVANPSHAQRRSAFKDAGAWDPDDDDIGLQALFSKVGTSASSLQSMRTVAGLCASLTVLAACEADADIATPSPASSGAGSSTDPSPSPSSAASTSVSASTMRAGATGTVPISDIIGEQLTAHLEQRGLKELHDILAEVDSERSGAATLYVRLNAAKNRRYAMRAVPRAARVVVGSYAKSQAARPATYTPPPVTDVLALPWTTWEVRDTKEELDLLQFLVWLGLLALIRDVIEVCDLDDDKEVREAYVAMKASVIGWEREWEKAFVYCPSNLNEVKALQAEKADATTRIAGKRDRRGRQRGNPQQPTKDTGRDRRDTSADAGAGATKQRPQRVGTPPDHAAGGAGKRFKRCHHVDSSNAACSVAVPKTVLDRLGGSKDPFCRPHRASYDKGDDDARTATRNRVKAKYPHVTDASFQVENR